MKIKKYLTIVVFVLGIILWTDMYSCPKAAGVNIDISAEQSEYKPGDTVYVFIRLTSDTAMSGFEGYFSYDNSVLRFVTGGGRIFGNDDRFQVSDVERDGTTNEIKYSVKFIARNIGTTSIKLKSPYAVYGETTDTKLSVSSNTLVVKVSNVAGNIQEPDRNMQMPAQGTALPEPSPKKTSKKKKNNSNKNSDTQAGINIIKRDDEIYLEGAFSLRIGEPNQEQIPENYTETVIEIENENIPAYARADEVTPSHHLLYGTRSDDISGEPAFYLYDSVTKGLIPFEKVKSLELSKQDESESEDLKDGLEEKKWKYVAAILIILDLLIACIIGIRKTYKNDNARMVKESEDLMEKRYKEEYEEIVEKYRR